MIGNKLVGFLVFAFFLNFARSIELILPLSEEDATKFKITPRPFRRTLTENQTAINFTKFEALENELITKVVYFGTTIFEDTNDHDPDFRRIVEYRVYDDRILITVNKFGSGVATVEETFAVSQELVRIGTINARGMERAITNYLSSTPSLEMDSSSSSSSSCCSSCSNSSSSSCSNSNEELDRDSDLDSISDPEFDFPMDSDSDSDSYPDSKLLSIVSKIMVRDQPKKKNDCDYLDKVDDEPSLSKGRVISPEQIEKEVQEIMKEHSQSVDISLPGPSGLSRNLKRRFQEYSDSDSDSD